MRTTGGTMVSVFLLMLVLAGAILAVTAGATAYELTGLDRETARFQALSAFTGTGFTTRVSQLVVAHPLRRRITEWLIIFGYASTATVVASLVASVGKESTSETLGNLAVMATITLVGVVTVRRYRLHVLEDLFRRVLAPRLTGDRVPHEELLLYQKGFGLSRIEVPPDSRLIGKSLRTLDLRGDYRIQLLAVEEGEDVHPIPDPDWCFEAGQHLIVYGDLRTLQAAFGPEDP